MSKQYLAAAIHVITTPVNSTPVTISAVKTVKKYVSDFAKRSIDGLTIAFAASLMLA